MSEVWVGKKIQLSITIEKHQKLIEITSRNDGIKLSKKTPLDNPLIPCTVVTLLPIVNVESEKKLFFLF